jgi:hypothetical protein
MGTQVEYKKGDVYLCRDFGLVEVEILDVSQTAMAVKTKLHGWVPTYKFRLSAHGRLGYVKRIGWWIFKVKVLVREDAPIPATGQELNYTNDDEV